VKLHKTIAQKIRNLKSSRGIPDLIIPEPIGNYHGLFIEMKRTDEVIFNKDGSLRKDEHLSEQNKIIESLKLKGYYASFACGKTEAITIIRKYLANKL